MFFSARKMRTRRGLGAKGESYSFMGSLMVWGRRIERRRGAVNTPTPCKPGLQANPEVREER
jgi:hypothetical protein